MFFEKRMAMMKFKSRETLIAGNLPNFLKGVDTNTVGAANGK